MKILAFEFSSPRRSVALLERNAGLPDVVHVNVDEAGGRSTRAFALIDSVLKKAGLLPENVDIIAVGIGPGSYAGIRGGIAVAQGWQLAREIKTIGISSVECLAVQAQQEKWRGRINIIIDAQKNEFYLATYELGESTVTNIEPLRLVDFATVQARVDAGEMVLSPDAVEAFSTAKLFCPDAIVLAKLAAKATEFITADKLEPIYLREANFVKAPPLRVID